MHREQDRKNPYGIEGNFAPVQSLCGHGYFFIGKNLMGIM
jgi:hypothetical protein